MKKAILYVSLCTVLLMTAVAIAGVPRLINYQGRLFESSGQPLSDGTYQLTFAIFDAPVGGDLKWSETQNSVAIIDGFFGTVLGSVVELSDTVFAGENRYLEVSVMGQPISPRTQFTANGYSLRVGTVDGASGGKIEGALEVTPAQSDTSGNGLVIVGANAVPALEASVDAAGFGNLSFYEPVDSKFEINTTPNKVLDVYVSPEGFGTISFYEPVDSKADPLATPFKVMDITVNQEGLGTMKFYEPVDSKNTWAGEAFRKVEIRSDGLYMFGEDEDDTSLIVQANGNIRGFGQLTMGENSSDAEQTTVLGFENTASGDSATVGGGSSNEASGESAVISGGYDNTASGIGSTVGGGSGNIASGNYAIIAGGKDNAAAGDFAIIPGGLSNVADGDYAFTAGRRAISLFNGSFVWADNTDQDFAATDSNQFIVRAANGVGINTNTPQGVFDVAGPAGDNSVNLPNESISPDEIIGEPGLAEDRDIREIILDQNTISAVDVITTTITTPIDGYIMVNGGGIVSLDGELGFNQALLQIDETSGGSMVRPYAVQVGVSYGGASLKSLEDATQNMSAQVQRVYFKPAGTHEFRLEALAAAQNSAQAVTTIYDPYITAVFYPTAYGSVASE